MALAVGPDGVCRWQTKSAIRCDGRRTQGQPNEQCSVLQGGLLALIGIVIFSCRLQGVRLAMVLPP